MSGANWSLVQLLGTWDGTPAHYPQVHARDRAHHRAACGLLLPRDVHQVAQDVFLSLYGQVTCVRCRRTLERHYGIPAKDDR